MTVTAEPAGASVWDDVVGQPGAVATLRGAVHAPVHAYLFVGPTGSTKHEAARAFAALLLTGRDDLTSRDARLALRGEHPDVHEVERAGPAISAEQARDIIHVTSLAPVEGERKVVVLADFVPPELITIASRCVRIDFRSIPDAVLAERLRAEGVDPDLVDATVAAAGGDISRARILAADPELVARRAAFAEIPSRLDGTGATVFATVDDLLARIEAAAAPLTARHADEIAELDARIERFGERGSGRKQLEDRHRRELRRHRVDELRSGLGVLAGAYRDQLAAGAHRPQAVVDAVRRIHEAVENLEHNPNEPLLLQSLLWSLPVS